MLSKTFTAYGYLPDGYEYIAPAADGGNIPPGGLTDAGLAYLMNTGTLSKATLEDIIYETTGETDTSPDTHRALRNIRVALTNSSVSPVDILVGPSDSIGDGIGASSITRRWVSVLRDQLRKRYQPSGVTGGIGYVDLWNQGAFPDHPVVSGLPVPNTSYGLGRQSLNLNQYTQTCTITAKMTSLDIIYRGTTVAGGEMFYTIDGDPGHLVAGGSGGKPSNGEYIEHITGLSSTTHTVIIYGWYLPGTQTAFTLEGVHIYDGDESAGIRLWEGGQSGYRAADYVSPNTGWVSAVGVVDPALIVLPVGSNDYVTGRTKAQTKADILSIIALERAQCTGDPSIILLPYWERIIGGTWDDYVSIYHEIANSDDDICVLDLGPIFGTEDGTTRDGLLSVDEAHPSDTGHRLIGEAIANLI